MSRELKGSNNVIRSLYQAASTVSVCLSDLLARGSVAPKLDVIQSNLQISSWLNSEARSICTPIYRRIAGIPRGLITRGPRSHADRSGEDYVIGIAVILRADLSQDESAADDRENEHPRGEMQRRLAVKQRRAASRLHFLIYTPPSDLSSLLTGTKDSRRLQRVTSPLIIIKRHSRAVRAASFDSFAAEVDFLLRIRDDAHLSVIPALAPRSTDEANTFRAYFLPHA